jgi:putative SOS response-associated peptidase YedK
VILRKEDEVAWLNPDTTEPAEILPLLRPYPADRMDEWPVSGEARNPAQRLSGAPRPTR